MKRHKASWELARRESNQLGSQLLLARTQKILVWGITMTVDLTTLDAHEQPSDLMRATWKSYAKADKADVLSGGDIDDLLMPEKAAEFQKAGVIPAEKLRTAFSSLVGECSTVPQVEEDATILYHPILPG